VDEQIVFYVRSYILLDAHKAHIYGWGIELGYWCFDLLIADFHLEGFQEVQNEEIVEWMMVNSYKGLHNLAAKQEFT